MTNNEEQNGEQSRVRSTLENPIDYPDIMELAIKADAESAKRFKPWKNSVMEYISSWLFVHFVNNTEFFSEQFVDDLSAWGKRMLEKYQQKFEVVDKALSDSIYDESLLLVAKKTSGICDPYGFLRAINNMRIFSLVHAEDAERNCMQYNIRANSATGLAAAFYFPALKWNLFKFIFLRS
jgi:hypothetical protein